LTACANSGSRPSGTRALGTPWPRRWPDPAATITTAQLPLSTSLMVPTLVGPGGIGLGEAGRCDGLHEKAANAAMAMSQNRSMLRQGWAGAGWVGAGAKKPPHHGVRGL